jgi:ceramide glucosyltransferase
MSEQLYLLRHATNTITSQTEVQDEHVNSFLEKLRLATTKITNKFEKPFKNVDIVQLPFGMTVYQYHFFAMCVLVGVVFHSWTNHAMYAFCWFWQLGCIVFCFKAMKRPDYNATRAKYKTHHDTYTNNGVTILKPLHGVPERLAANLETYFTLKYPTYELILCIKQRKGQEKLIELCEQLMNKYPQVKCTISYGHKKWGINPKLCNMGTGYEIAAYNLVWVADANIVCSDCVIQDMVDKILSTDKCALVHQVPWMISGPSTKSDADPFLKGYITGGSVLDRWYFATGHARGYFVINGVLCTCLNGMSNMIKKTHLEAVGGLKKFAQFVAEDSEIGAAFDTKGYSSQLCAHAGLQNLAETDFSVYIDRRVRWSRLRYNMPKTSITGPFEVLQESQIYMLFNVMGLCWHWGVWTFVFPICFAHGFVWLLVDAIVFAILDRSIGLPEAWEDTPHNNLVFDWGKVTTNSGGLFKFLVSNGNGCIVCIVFFCFANRKTPWSFLMICFFLFVVFLGSIIL